MASMHCGVLKRQEYDFTKTLHKIYISFYIDFTQLYKYLIYYVHKQDPCKLKEF